MPDIEHLGVRYRTVKCCFLQGKTIKPIKIKELISGTRFADYLVQNQMARPKIMRIENMATGLENDSETIVNKAPNTSVSGQGMDRAVSEKKKSNRYTYAVLGAVLLLGGYWVAQESITSGKSIKLERHQVIISEVKQGVFEDVIPVRARVTPLKTVFLDAIEGGRVERVLVEDGAVVEKGALIAELSNTSLQLQVMGNEALVTEQLNNLRTIELQLAQNRLSHKRNLAEFDYQILKLTRQAVREGKLIKTSAVSSSQLENTQDELAYNIERRKLTLESQATDARIQEQQLSYLKSRAEQLERNLKFAHQNLEALSIKAPVSGKISGFDIEVGQSISRGGRLGQIDDPSRYKLVAHIDEFYLGRVDIGQRVEFDRDGVSYNLQISKIYPQVNNGQFEVDMTFADEQAEGIRRGQSLQTRLMLGEATIGLLIPNGAFYQDTGGNWVFVVTSDGAVAVKRSVKLGRRNSRFIEVLEGLEEGERVVTSPYTNYTDMDRLKLN
ncbi:efflux RND transporter periplasmic adaptor subunit [Kordiimonas sp. SCSIO 12603]|uniref:efflux RND transporter periplasmic adaptor subunit n=1 Tax=Kordiimonas sp. SCSIO 12603 TaxID=2829596 RepID=UPI00210229DD|nr:efflux RND transporter periplasmic adaptor subunit [Kordiimonas sp. SCSIO 12603]UTW57427.1 efflux RND transporter periplasmic adaptor subunit [Kordiimonas sp. SCSIO 12603]